MGQYNLIDEQWIPVRDLEGNRKELGIRDVLLTAENLSVIEDPSPLVTAAIHRFLLAVLYRALRGPCDIDEAKKLFTEGLPKDKIRAYLNEWKDRFWLFDEKYPFGQNPNIPESEVEPWTKLTVEYNSTSNKVLFDHTDTRNPCERTFAECGRWLLAIMSFSVSGGRGYYPSPSPNAVICFPMGRTLEETLLYSLVPQNLNVLMNDLPIWEKSSPQLPIPKLKRMAAGYADLYTWPARFVLLKQQSSGNVKFVRFVAGEGFEKDSRLLDPMQSYRKNDEHGLLPIQFKERGFWRDFQSILPDGEGVPPKNLENAIELTRRQRARMPGSVVVLGLRNEPPSANLEFWRMERFVLPEALAGDRCVGKDIRTMLEEAEDTSKSLYSACAGFAEASLSHGDRKPDKGDSKKFIAQMPSLSSYWTILELKFHAILRDYTLECNPDNIHHDWLVCVRQALQDGWNLHEQSVCASDAWTIRAMVKASEIIKRKTIELNKSIKQLKEGA